MALAHPFGDASGGSSGVDTSSSAPHIYVLNRYVMHGYLCLGPIGETFYPHVDNIDYEVHDILDAPDVMTRTRAYPRESSHVRDEEVPSSYTDNVVVRLVIS